MSEPVNGVAIFGGGMIKVEIKIVQTFADVAEMHAMADSLPRSKFIKRLLANKKASMMIQELPKSDRSTSITGSIVLISKEAA